MISCKLILCFLFGCYLLVNAGEIDTELQPVQQDSALSAAFRSQLPGNDLWFGKDKFDHFLMSTFLVSLSYYHTNVQWKFSPPSARNFSVGLTLSLGIGKEIWDKTTHKGFPSYRDLIADLLGVGLGYWIISWNQN
jgi:uncharacterized protein YfiM (DUF2279 family)